ncbi:MAG TPA: hypothetical protein VGN52_01580 [Burkholderiales bacterium]
MQDRDSSKPNFNTADERSPAQREKELLQGAHAEGRAQPADGTRPLSSAEPKPQQKPEGSFKHIVHTGLPPGIEVEDAVDPGSRNLRERKNSDRT